MGEANLAANAAPDFPEYLPLFYKYSENRAAGQICPGRRGVFSIP